MADTTDGHPTTEPAERECFVIMPISDPDGYAKGHFERVYKDIFIPACKEAKFTPIRADDVLETNLIHADILRRIIDAPMALCDLSSRNPNVLFELGIRQAFDKPVVLVEEVDTPRIFDIAPLRATPYRKERLYNEVIEDQKKITEALKATEKACAEGRGFNSIVQILSIAPATLKELGDAADNPAFQLLRSEISALRTEFRKVKGGGKLSSSRVRFPDFFTPNLHELIADLEGRARDFVRNANTYPPAQRDSLYHALFEGLHALSPTCPDAETLARLDAIRENLFIARSMPYRSAPESVEP